MHPDRHSFLRHAQRAVALLVGTLATSALAQRVDPTALGQGFFEPARRRSSTPWLEPELPWMPP